VITNQEIASKALDELDKQLSIDRAECDDWYELGIYQESIFFDDEYSELGIDEFNEKTIKPIIARFVKYIDCTINNLKEELNIKDNICVCFLDLDEKNENVSGCFLLCKSEAMKLSLRLYNQSYVNLDKQIYRIDIMYGLKRYC